jgi:hypothetical protein
MLEITAVNVPIIMERKIPIITLYIEYRTENQKLFKNTNSPKRTKTLKGDGT